MNTYPVLKLVLLARRSKFKIAGQCFILWKN